jgi:glycine cleavage system H lipoate-binding protein
MNTPDTLRYTREHEWIRIEMSNPAEVEELLAPAAYRQLLGQ